MGDAKTKERGPCIRQFSVMLPNRAGALEALMQLLHTVRIELLGLSVQDSRDATMARIVVSDADGAEEVFLEKGIPHTTSELVVVAFRDPGREFAECLRHLRAAETNIDFAYALLPHPEGRTLLALHVEDHEFAASVLHQAGLMVLNEEDLCR
jgi:hypothetical protein